MTDFLLGYFAVGVLFSALLAAMVAPRVWPERRELAWLAGLCVVSVPLYPLVLIFLLALKDDRFYDWVRRVASDADDL